jgi:hypothetical protein
MEVNGHLRTPATLLQEELRLVIINKVNWVSPKPSLDALDDTYFLLLPGIEPHFLARPARNLVFIQTELPRHDRPLNQRSNCSSFTQYVSIRTEDQQANFFNFFSDAFHRYSGNHLQDQNLQC